MERAKNDLECSDARHSSTILMLLIIELNIIKLIVKKTFPLFNKFLQRNKKFKLEN